MPPRLSSRRSIQPWPQRFSASNYRDGLRYLCNSAKNPLPRLADRRPYQKAALTFLQTHYPELGRAVPMFPVRPQYERGNTTLYRAQSLLAQALRTTRPSGNRRWKRTTPLQLVAVCLGVEVMLSDVEPWITKKRRARYPARYADAAIARAIYSLIRCEFKVYEREDMRTGDIITQRVRHKLPLQSMAVARHMHRILEPIYRVALADHTKDIADMVTCPLLSQGVYVHTFMR